MARFPATELRVSGALCLMSDLTELTALQKQIRWKENLAALGEMSAGIAHEFKNSLATISGYAQMIRSEAKPGDTRDSAERILDQTRALTHVVTEFLRFAKPLEICYETVSMQNVVDKVAEELRETVPGCRVEAEGSFLELPGDEALMRQALVNLVRNGVQAATGSGASEREGEDIGTLEDLGGRKWQRICVADNGARNPRKRPAQDLSALLYDQVRGYRAGPGRGAEGGSAARRQHRGPQPGRWRGRVPPMVTFAAGPLPSPIASRAARI